MAYDAPITRAKKALIVFLTDHSESMKLEWKNGIIRDVKVAELLNDVIEELVASGATTESGYVDRLDFALVGYGSSPDDALEGSLVGKGIVTSLELRMAFRGVESDGRTPYVTPKHDKGTTEMAEAFKYVERLVTEWTKNNPDNYPPTVIHITDGEPTGIDPTQAAESLKKTGTTDGNTLLWNLHISPEQGDPVVMPTNPGDVASKLGSHLCAMSSMLPQGSRRFKEDAGKYAFTFNAKPDDLANCLAIGTQNLM